MKKLFKYEINESIAAKAAMNCVHKRLFKELYSFGAPMPQEEVVRGDYDPYEWEYDDYGNEEKRHLIHQALVQAGLTKSEKEGWQFNNEIQQLLDKTNFSVSNEQDAMKFVKTYGQQIVGETQEQEETDYTNDDIPSYHFSYQNSFLVWAMRNVIPYLKEMSQVCAQADPTELKHAVMKVLKEEGRFGAPESERGCEHWAEEKRWKVEEFLGGSQEQEEDGINKGGMHNSVQVGHIMNTPSYDMNDLRNWRDNLDFSNNDDDDADEETYTAYDDTDGIWMIINLMRKKGMLRAQGIEGRDDVDDGQAIDKAYDLIEQKLNDEGMWIGDDDHEAERFVSFFGDEIAEEAMKSALHNQEQEEEDYDFEDPHSMTSLQRHDMMQEVTQCMAEVLEERGIDVGGDLDEIYFIISDIIERTGDVPQFVEDGGYYPWCEEYVFDVEDLL